MLHGYLFILFIVFVTLVHVVSVRAYSVSEKIASEYVGTLEQFSLTV
jgi:hypothetical protein